MIDAIKDGALTGATILPPIVTHNDDDTYTKAVWDIYEKARAMDKSYYMYVLLTADNTFYGGLRMMLVNVFATHEAGKGAKYTRPASRHPLKLLYAEAFATKGEALHAEAVFKKLKRVDKVAFLREHGVTDFTPEKRD